jgi:hypothetical protein
MASPDAALSVRGWLELGVGNLSVLTPRTVQVHPASFDLRRMGDLLRWFPVEGRCPLGSDEQMFGAKQQIPPAEQSD